jgi:hypothetical protein
VDKCNGCVVIQLRREGLGIHRVPTAGGVVNAWWMPGGWLAEGLTITQEPAGTQQAGTKEPRVTPSGRLAVRKRRYCLRLTARNAAATS